MWKSYFKIVGRHFWKNRSYTLINLLGLTVGIACCLLIMIYVQDERSYDRWHDKGEQIYRMVVLSPPLLVSSSPPLWRALPS